MKSISGYEVQWSDNTPSEVKRWIEYAHQGNKRVRLFYGDTERPDFERVHGRNPDPGEDWGEEHDVTGIIGISTGWKPIPLLINNSRSMGGGAIMTDCIVRMFVDGREVYRHPNYHSDFETAIVIESDLPEYSHAVMTQGGDIVARFHTLKSAKNWLAFMRGERMSK